MKKEILARLDKGETQEALSKEYGISAILIAKWVNERAALTRDIEVGIAKAELLTGDDLGGLIKPSPKVQRDVVKEEILEVSHADDPKLAIEMLRDKAETSDSLGPKARKSLFKALDKIEDNVDGLKLLESEFQLTIINLLAWAKGMITDDMKISEWDTLVSGISRLHTTVYGKNGTNVVINNANQQVNSFREGFRP